MGYQSNTYIKYKFYLQYSILKELATGNWHDSLDDCDMLLMQHISLLHLNPSLRHTRDQRLYPAEETMETKATSELMSVIPQLLCPEVTLKATYCS